MQLLDTNSTLPGPGYIGSSSTGADEK